MTDTMTARIAYHAVEIKPLKLFLSVLAAPFYALGFVAAVLWFGVAWLIAAVTIGFADAKSRRAR